MSKNRFAIVLVLILSIMATTVLPVFAAEEITIPSFSYEGLPFDSLPTTRTSFWIIKHANGSYTYVSSGSAFTSTSVNLSTKSISSSLYSASVYGNNWKYASFSNGSWSTVNSDSGTYFWFLLYEGDEIVYCSIPVYDPDGNLIWPTDNSSVETPTEPSEPSDPTEPPIVDDGEGTTEEEPSWIGSVIDRILNGIAGAFEFALSPLIDALEPFLKTIENLTSLGDRFSSLEDIWNTYSGYTFQPILDFFGTINIKSVNAIIEVWNFPIIGEFSIAKVSLLVVSGILLLMITF